MPKTLRHLTSEALLRGAMTPIVKGLWHAHADEESMAHVNGPCFLYGNHSNNLDAFIFNYFRPWGEVSSGILTAEYMRGGIVTWTLKGIGLLSTRKRVPEPHLISRIMRLLDAGRMVFIYPEGGRRWDGRPAPWIEATAKLFSRVQVPVYPILTHGSYVGWPRWARYPRPARIRCVAGQAVPVERGLSLEENLRLLKEPIAADENLPPEDVRPRRAFRPAEGIERLLYRDPVSGENGGLYTPDGEYVLNRSSSIRWRMLPDSTLLDEQTGEIRLTGDLYEHIRALPLEKDKSGCQLEAHVQYYRGGLEGAQTPIGKARVRLFETHLEVCHGHHTETVSMDDIRYSGVERNFKWEVTNQDSILRFDFVHRGSALQWDDIMNQRIDARNTRQS